MVRFYCLIVLTCLLIAGQRAAQAGIRDLSVFVEAEDFTPTNDDWKPGEGWADDIYTATSGNAVLANGGGGQGEASTEVVIPAAGDYHVWVRYLKVGAYAGRPGPRSSPSPATPPLIPPPASCTTGAFSSVIGPMPTCSGRRRWQPRSTSGRAS
jgi:hypothetical protein